MPYTKRPWRIARRGTTPTAVDIADAEHRLADLIANLGMREQSPNQHRAAVIAARFLLDRLRDEAAGINAYLKRVPQNRQVRKDSGTDQS